ncbi:C2 domain-containing protein 5-like isoform X1 [Tigriopus californicus]|uniref:C2 domain-containing protein 5-like isoform X1 n=1 Tax=Tigriopus californicus TaxID=6832 RepID=UPI0027DA6A31|nr:C2 domain-containing protein 5-like isoform X1 [Tigriopus californicus]
MPGKVKVRILAARHLPVMDRSSENTDAFAEVKFGEVTHKTEVVRKSLNPQWNSEWFHFEAADDMKLQDEPLQIRVMDYDTYSANDAIGKVYIDLNPLLWPSVAVNAGRSNQAWSDSSTGGLVHTPGGSLMSGWLPIYDTMHGIRGEVNVIVKIEFFSDFNQFRQSSCGVQFFYSPCVPEGYRVQAINGFVEELVVNDDPEYQWIDKIRTPRASNEARQTLFMKLSGTIQRKIGLKALELGGNVVVGYQQKFDIEGDTGIAVRGIGTAMSLVRDDPVTISSTVMNGSGSNKGLSENRESVEPPSCYYYHANDHFNSPHPIIGSNPDPKTHARSGIDATMSEFCLLSASPPQFEPFHHVKSAKPFGIGAFVAEVATKFDNSQQRIVHLRSVSSAGLISPIWSSPTHPHRSSLRAQMDRQVSPKLGNISSGGFDFHEHDTGNNDTVPHPKISMDGSTRSMENGSKSIMISGGSSSNLEQLSISPKGPSSGDRMGTKLNLAATKSGIQLENQHDLLEYPFITLQKFPPSFINKIGGFVSCRSVKILDGVEDDGEIRENWWSEIRQEIRSHARCLGCNMVVGYSEDTVIWDDVVVLCASGTAASGNLHYMLDLDTNGSIFGPAFLNKNDVNLGKAQGSIGNGGEEALPSSASSVPIVSNGSGVWGGSCSYAHIPYLEYTLPFTSKCGKCQCCGKGRVPDVLFTTIEPPSHFDITGRGCLIQAKVLRLKKDLKGESNAKEISDALPFIEYEIHRQLINKLKVKGMNALFGLKLKVSMGDRTIIGTATATACYMTALSTPSKPKLICSSAFPNDPNYLQRCQKRLNLKIAENEKYYGLNPIKRIPSTQSNVSDPVEHDQEDGPESEFTSGNKDTCVLEIDDSEDADILDSLMDPYPPPYVQVFSTEELVGISKGLYVETCQTFSQVWRGRIHPSSRDLSSACQRLLAAIYFKLRRLRPCIVSHVSFQADLDEENELQLCIYGTAIGLGQDGKTRAEIEAALKPPGDGQKDTSPTELTGRNANIGLNGTKTVNMECNQSSSDGASDSSTSSPSHSIDSQVGRCEMRMPKSQTGVVSIPKFFTSETHQALFPGSILLTPSSFVPGARIDKYLGNLNFFIIRESSSLREAGGLNQFIQSFLSEVNAIVRSHVHALGGNALVAFFMLEFVVEHSTHKNQGQCLVHVGGDVVSVTYMK